MKTRFMLAVVMAGIVLGARGGASQRDRANPEVTQAQYGPGKKTNWGRWGPDDQIGTLHVITPAKRKQAAGLVKEGFSVSLAADPDTEKAVDNPNPYEHQMLGIGADRWGVAYHGVAHGRLGETQGFRSFRPGANGQ